MREMLLYRQKLDEEVLGLVAPVELVFTHNGTCICKYGSDTEGHDQKPQLEICLDPARPPLTQEDFNRCLSLRVPASRVATSTGLSHGMSRGSEPLLWLYRLYHDGLLPAEMWGEQRSSPVRHGTSYHSVRSRASVHCCFIDMPKSPRLWLAGNLFGKTR